MNDSIGPMQFAGYAAGSGDWIVFTLGEKRFALPRETVEAVVAPPPLATIPHAPFAVLGAGNLGGRMTPVIDLARLLGLAGSTIAYTGGNVLRLRASVGIWVDRAQRLLHRVASDDLDGIEILDLGPLLASALVAPKIAGSSLVSLGEAATGRPTQAAVSPVAVPFVAVAVAGRQVHLRRQSVVELLDALPWAAVPCAPSGFIGVGLLREMALPILSLSTLLELPELDLPGGFVMTELWGRRMLLGVARLVGLRDGSDIPAIDLEAIVPDELRQVILGFPSLHNADPLLTAKPEDRSAAYLVFAVAGQDCAIPIDNIDRIVGAQPLVALPKSDWGDGSRPRLDGAIEYRGQIVPVAPLYSRLVGKSERATGAPSPDAYVILHGEDGPGAIGVDHIRQVVSLDADDIKPPHAGESAPIAGIATLPEGGLLRVLAAERLWGGE